MIWEKRAYEEIAEVCAALREIGEEARRQRDIRRPGKSERTLEEQAADLLEGLSAAREAVLAKPSETHFRSGTMKLSEIVTDKDVAALTDKYGELTHNRSVAGMMRAIAEIVATTTASRVLEECAVLMETNFFRPDDAAKAIRALKSAAGSGETGKT